MYLVALNLLLNNQLIIRLNSSLRHIIVTQELFESKSRHYQFILTGRKKGISCIKLAPFFV